MKDVLDLTIYLVLFNSIISYFCPKVQFKYQFTPLLCLGACKDYFGMDLTCIIYQMDLERLRHIS